MKKYLAVRIGLLAIGFLLIYCYAHWDHWFNPRPSIGGNDGMSIPADLVFNISWIIIWCILLFIEIAVSLFTAKNKDRIITNITLIILGILGLGVYILSID